MSVINIRLAQREGARLVIGIGGISGSGKTFTAVMLAYGLANYDASKVGFIDTENKRGSLYADILPDGQQFYIGDLEPPFSPQRYSDAIKAFQAAGVEVLIIDSISHEHEGTGGLLEMREPEPGKSAKRDNYAKAEHKKMMNTLLQSNMHIIVCVRAREKVTIGKDAQNRTVYESQGVQPICEKNFMFEMTASMLMWDEGKKQDVLKCPSALQPILGRASDYITAEDGKALRDWVDGAKKLDPVVEAARSELKMVCQEGMAALTAAWKKLPAAVRKAIDPKGCPEEYKLAAQAFDAQSKPAPNDALDELNQEIGAAA